LSLVATVVVACCATGLAACAVDSLCGAGWQATSSDNNASRRIEYGVRGTGFAIFTDGFLVCASVRIAAGGVCHLYR
jgi:hypothetical protein